MDPARKSSKDDIIIIISYALEFEEAKTFKPWIIFPNENNNSLTITISSKINVILTLQTIIPIVFFYSK
jgi:aspartate 1-decarboxylase